MLNVDEACEEQSVAGLYQNTEVAETYVDKRFTLSWSQLLHETQAVQVNRVIRESQPEMVVEVAPGPARLTTEIRGIQKGVLIEYSQEMLVQAKQRLGAAGLSSLWEVRHGNAFDLEKQHIQCHFLFTFRFIRHFKREDRGRLYRGIHACLRSQGLLMFDVVNRTVRQKLDAKRRTKSAGELDVYDATYSADEFNQEMNDHGFEVLSLVPVIRHFSFQSWISYTLDHRIGKGSRALVCLIECLPSANPLEWIALCRKVE